LAESRPNYGLGKLDSIQHQAENADMRRAHKFALILGVLLGLFGQIATVAADPAVATAISANAAATMPMDCVGMTQDDGEKPLLSADDARLPGRHGVSPLYALESRGP
jgi:hypothetical protein